MPSVIRVANDEANYLNRGFPDVRADLLGSILSPITWPFIEHLLHAQP